MRPSSSQVYGAEDHEVELMQELENVMFTILGRDDETDEEIDAAYDREQEIMEQLKETRAYISKAYSKSF